MPKKSEKKPTYLQWLRSKGACPRGLQQTRADKTFANALYYYPVAWVEWLAWVLQDEQLLTATNRLEAAKRDVKIRLAELDLPWQDGFNARWRR